jgi:flagellar basal body-associated protein FliL
MSNPKPASTGAPWYGILLLITVVAAAGGIATLWPASGATYPSLLGYRSFCTFAPAASLYCFLVAGITCTVRATLVKRRRLYGKPVVNKGAIIVLAVVLAAAVATTAWFVVEKRSYAQTDTTTAATEEP